MTTSTAEGEQRERVLPKTPPTMDHPRPCEDLNFLGEKQNFRQV